MSIISLLTNHTRTNHLKKIIISDEPRTGSSTSNDTMAQRTEPKLNILGRDFGTVVATSVQDSQRGLISKVLDTIQEDEIEARIKRLQLGNIVFELVDD